MRCTYIPFPCPSDPQGCYTDAECFWAPNFDFTEPQIFGLTGPDGASLLQDQNRLRQARDFILDYGAMASAREELA